MVIMMLDHTRDFVHWGALQFDPTDLGRTSPALFLTRWITHFCAPVFVLLAGTSAWFQLQRGKTPRELSRFLVTRGLWLIVLELVVIRFLVLFNFAWASGFFVQVIWAIGWSMIALAALIHLRPLLLAAFGIGMIALHNLFDSVTVSIWQGPGTEGPGWLGGFWMILHQPGPLPLGQHGPIVFVLYPLIPWVGVMAVGYALGTLYEKPSEERAKLLLRLGIAVTVGFVVLRASNVYGDAARWSIQSDPVFTALSFLNTTKYPPSLLFLLMTLGPSLMALAWFDKLEPSRWVDPLLVFGRVPLFFYLLQWAVAHGLGIGLRWVRGQDASHLYGAASGSFPAPAGDGFSLATTYLFWVLGLVLVYPLCAWFARLKQRRRQWRLLGYL